MVAIDAEPRRACGEAGRLACRPLHRRAAVVARARPDDLHRLILRLARGTQDVVVIDALDVAVVGDVREVGIRHADLLTLIDVRRAAHEVNRGGEHLGRLLPIFAGVAKARDDARLVVVAPEDGIPAAACGHALLPRGEDLLEFVDVRRHQRPLVAVLVVDLEVVEGKRHRFNLSETCLNIYLIPS